MSLLTAIKQKRKKEYMCNLCILQNTSVCCAHILMKVLSNLPLASTHATLYTQFWPLLLLESHTVFTISTNSPLLTASSSSAFYRLSCTLFTEQIFIISAQYTTTHLSILTRVTSDLIPETCIHSHLPLWLLQTSLTLSISCSPQHLPCIVVEPDSLLITSLQVLFGLHSTR